MAVSTIRRTRPPGPIAAELAALTDTLARCQYRVVCASADFADSVEWVAAGAPTAAHYLAGLADIETCTARDEAQLRALIHDANQRPINGSGLQRHPTTRQKRVVKERDRACVDCGRHDLLEYDHVPADDVTGGTLVDELELRCAPCHHRRHRQAA